MPNGVGRRAAVVAFAVVAVLLVPATTAFAGNGGLLPLPAHSPNAHRIRDAYVFVTIFAAIIFVIVEGALLVLITRYRRGKRSRYQEGPQIHGSTRLEILWTVVPVIMLAAIGGSISNNALTLYSAGLAAQAIGLPLKRWQATMVDGAIAIRPAEPSFSD